MKRQPPTAAAALDIPSSAAEGEEGGDETPPGGAGGGLGVPFIARPRAAAARFLSLSRKRAEGISRRARAPACSPARPRAITVLARPPACPIAILYGTGVKLDTRRASERGYYAALARHRRARSSLSLSLSAPSEPTKYICSSIEATSENSRLAPSCCYCSD